MKSVDLDLHNALAKIGESVVGLVRESGLLRRKRRTMKRRARRRTPKATAAPRPRPKKSKARPTNSHATPPPGASPVE